MSVLWFLWRHTIAGLSPNSKWSNKQAVQCGCSGCYAGTLMHVLAHLTIHTDTHTHTTTKVARIELILIWLDAVFALMQSAIKERAICTVAFTAPQNTQMCMPVCVCHVVRAAVCCCFALIVLWLLQCFVLADYENVHLNGKFPWIVIFYNRFWARLQSTVCSALVSVRKCGSAGLYGGRDVAWHCSKWIVTFGWSCSPLFY